MGHKGGLRACRETSDSRKGAQINQHWAAGCSIPSQGGPSYALCHSCTCFLPVGAPPRGSEAGPHTPEPSLRAALCGI